MIKVKSCLLLLLSVVAQASTVNLSEADQQAITQTAQNYANGWYNGDREQMNSALHDKLAKRAYLNSKDGKRALEEMSKEVLVNAVKPGNAKYYADKPKRAEVEILDGFANVATVKLQMDGWVDYLHIVRTENNQWRIINVLWEVYPK